VPLFFSYHNLVFIGQAMGRTLAMTAIGCSVGFFFGFFIAVLRQSSDPALFIFRWLAITYVEIFRRIPF
ncbi:uncharacterized protein METZ01_LOCUS415547, partial [marine metagenome]